MSRSTVKGLANDAEPKQGVAKIVRELLEKQSECRAGGLQGRLEQLNSLLEVGGEDRFRGASSDVALWGGAKAGERSQYLPSPGKGGKAIGQGELDATQSCEGVKVRHSSSQPTSLCRRVPCKSDCCRK